MWGGGEGAVCWYWIPACWQEPAEGPSGHRWSSLPLELACLCHSKVLLSPFLARVKLLERLQQAPHWPPPGYMGCPLLSWKARVLPGASCQPLCCPHPFPLLSQDCQTPAANHAAKDRPIPSPMASLSKR